jgi:hypothetical protein
MVETELQVEMRRYIKLTEGWSGHHRYKILCTWMGTARMKDMNDFLAAQARESKLHSDAPKLTGDAD